MSNIIQFVLGLATILSVALSFQTQFYGGPGGYPDPVEYLNQGRINGVSSWGRDSQFQALIIKGMSADQSTKSFPAMGTYGISSSCSSFSLQSNEYINGYRVKWRNSGTFKTVVFLGFTTSNGNTYTCNIASGGGDTGWIYPSNVYLTGIATKCASVIDSVSLEFSPVPTSSPTPSPTSNPTFNPTPAPTNIPTNIPTHIPTHIPSNIPTFYPTQNPTNTPTTEPTTNPTSLLPTTNVPTTSIPTTITPTVPTVPSPINDRDEEVGTTEISEENLKENDDSDKGPLLILGMELWRVFTICGAIVLICMCLIITICYKYYKLRLNNVTLNAKHMTSRMKTPGETKVEMEGKQTNTVSDVVLVTAEIVSPAIVNIDSKGNTQGNSFITDVSSDSESDPMGLTTNGNQTNESPNVLVSNNEYESMDISTYYQWNANDILLWILSLDEGRYLKYENILRKSLIEEGICGEDLNEVDTSDIKGWGIIAFKDKKNLYQRIQELISQHQQEDHDEELYHNNVTVTQTIYNGCDV